MKKPVMGGERGERCVMRADQALQHKDDRSGNNKVEQRTLQTAAIAARRMEERAEFSMSWTSA